MKKKHGYSINALKKRGFTKGFYGHDPRQFRKFAVYMNAYRKGQDARKKQDLKDLVLASPSEKISPAGILHIDVNKVRLGTGAHVNKTGFVRTYP